MDRSVSWTNRDKLNELLSKATGRPNKSTASRLAGVTGFSTGRQEPTSLPTPLAAAAPPAPKEVPPLTHTSTNPSDQLDALIDWALKHFPCSGAFVADDNGLTLAAHGISEAHVALVGPLLSSLVSIRSIPDIDGTLGALWLGSGMMSWAETRTERGAFCLGVLSTEAMPTRSLRQLKDALELTVTSL